MEEASQGSIVPTPLITPEALTDFESWGLMREHRDMSFEEACNIWIDAVDRLLPPAPESSDGARV